MMRVRFAAWVGLGLAVLVVAGCRYRQDANPFEGLGQGDVTGILVGVPPGTQSDNNVALQGARARLVGGVAVATTRDNGKFILRNVAEGPHRLNLLYDPDRDGVPDLAAVVTLAITIPPLRAARPSVNLGEVVLLKPGRVKGSVSVDGLAPGDPRLAHVYVAVREVDLTVHVDPVTAGFEVKGLGAGHWTLAAGYLDRTSDDVGIDILPDQEIVLPPLALSSPAPGTGTITATLRPPGVDGPTAIDFARLPQPLLDLPRMVAALQPLDPSLAGTTPAALDSSQATEEGMPIRLEARPGLYHLEIVFETTDVPPLRVPNIPVRAGRTTDLGNLFAMWTKVGACVDQDGDGRCWLDGTQGGTCVDECRRAARDPDAPCTQGGEEFDCDDDADGQSDPEEQVGRMGALDEGESGGACRCSSTGDLPEGTPTCDRDPTRADHDGDGICDRYDAFPGCALNTLDCTRQGSPFPGVPSAFIPARVRAGVTGDRSPFGSTVKVSAISDDEVAVLADIGAAISLPAPCADVTPADAGPFGLSDVTYMLARYGLSGTCVARAVLQGDPSKKLTVSQMVVVPGTGEAWIAGAVSGPSLAFEGTIVDAGAIDTFEEVGFLMRTAPLAASTAPTERTSLLLATANRARLSPAPVVMDLALAGAGHDVVLLLSLGPYFGTATVSVEIAGNVVLDLQPPAQVYAVVRLSSDLSTLIGVSVLDTVEYAVDRLPALLVDGDTVRVVTPGDVPLPLAGDGGVTFPPRPGRTHVLAFSRDLSTVVDETTDFSSPPDAGPPAHLLHQHGSDWVAGIGRRYFESNREQLGAQRLTASGVDLDLVGAEMVVAGRTGGGATLLRAIQGDTPRFDFRTNPGFAVLSTSTSTGGELVAAGVARRAMVVRDGAGNGLKIRLGDENTSGFVVRVPSSGGPRAWALLAAPEDLGRVPVLATSPLPGGGHVAFGVFSGRVAFGRGPGCSAYDLAGRTLVYYPPESFSGQSAAPFLWVVRPADFEQQGGCTLAPASGAASDVGGSVFAPSTEILADDLVAGRSVVMDFRAWGDEDCVAINTAAQCHSLSAASAATDGACSIDTQLRLMEVVDGTPLFRTAAQDTSDAAPCARLDAVLRTQSRFVLCMRGYAGEPVGSASLQLTTTSSTLCLP